MPHHMAFCSACDRPVPVDLMPARRPGQPQDARDVVCLEYPARCTGSMCPLFSIQDDALARRDERSARDARPPREQEQRL